RNTAVRLTKLRALSSTGEGKSAQNANLNRCEQTSIGFAISAKRCGASWGRCLSRQRRPEKLKVFSMMCVMQLLGCWQTRLSLKRNNFKSLLMRIRTLNDANEHWSNSWSTARGLQSN